jgi:Fe2+ transport system protein FeoA
MSQQPKADAPADLTIADLAPGMEARIISLQAVQEIRRERLLAYGVAPGRTIQVLQRSPVTILKVDQTELAIENDVASRITVAEPRRMKRLFHIGHRRRKRRFRRGLNFLQRRKRRKR